MTRFLLDTNVISNVTKLTPSVALLEWLAEQVDEDLFISSLTLAEISRGVLEMPAGKKRRELETWFGGPDGPPALFAGRVLAFDERAALEWARLMADGKALGRPRSALDTIIAAIAKANGCIVVTDNERDFEGVASINPLRGAK
ncbi:PIN domain-containing protein [Rhizobium sp. CC-YZS058]|uniref:PIN domain-containing protein n=1 Tax=Rhizobium sp. CC-YZS058 TaxID=3042153 RepID=UPI002B060571|nr:PIN domain-containing protein [Rhizobium sp. CC-YZS058]MEA3536720.1 PIN domain-containing protein [Rhizobium sp. CC-YZS058]